MSISAPTGWLALRPSGHTNWQTFAGCILDDIEILGGDLPVDQGGQGFFAERDDDCAKSCEDNARCQ